MYIYICMYVYIYIYIYIYIYLYIYLAQTEVGNYLSKLSQFLEPLSKLRCTSVKDDLYEGG